MRRKLIIFLFRNSIPKLYCFFIPPLLILQIFDERTGKQSTAPMTFWSKFGAKVAKNKESRSEEMNRKTKILTESKEQSQCEL